MHKTDQHHTSLTPCHCSELLVTLGELSLPTVWLPSVWPSQLSSLILRVRLWLPSVACASPSPCSCRLLKLGADAILSQMAQYRESLLQSGWLFYLVKCSLGCNIIIKEEVHLVVMVKGGDERSSLLLQEPWDSLWGVSPGDPPGFLGAASHGIQVPKLIHGNLTKGWL